MTGTASAIADRGEMIELLRNSGEANLQFYLGEKLEFDVPDLHVTIWDYLNDTALKRVLLAIPRGHAKTTLAKIAVVHYFYYTKFRFCVYLSNTNGIAKNACRDIMEYMALPNHEQVFGPIKLIKASETESVWIFEIVDASGRRKKCILRAMGVNQQVRGLNIDDERPDILVADDVEDRENTATEILQAGLDGWIFGTLLKALGRQTKIIWIGNIIRKTTLLARLSKNPDWNPVVYGCLVQSPEGEIVPLWPDLWPLTEIVKDFKEYADLGQTETWMCEMMNMPGYGKNGFKADQIKFRPCPTPGDVKASFITIDPAFGLKSGVNDKTAIVCHAIDQDNVPVVVGYVHDHLTEPQMFDASLLFAELWNAWVWGIESIAAQSVLIKYFELLMTMRGIPNVAELVPLMSGRGDPKSARISAWVNLMATGGYYIAEGDVQVTAQLLAYDVSKKQQADDLIDSCAYGPQMLERYYGLILETFERKQVLQSERLRESLYGVELTDV